MKRLPFFKSKLPKISTAPQALRDNADRRRRYRDKAEPWRRWYFTEAWRRIRDHVFTRDRCKCQECGKVFSTARLVAHHIRPHKGDPELFWRLANITTVCKGCHDGVIRQRELDDKAKGLFFE